MRMMLMAALLALLAPAVAQVPDRPRALNSANLSSPPTAAPTAAIEDRGPLSISGQLAYSAEARGIPPDLDVTAQTKIVMQRIDAMPRAEGLGMGHIIKVTISTIDFADFVDFPPMNAVYSRWVQEPFPARSTIGVAFLPFRAKAEIEVIARRP